MGEFFCQILLKENLQIFKHEIGEWRTHKTIEITKKISHRGIVVHIPQSYDILINYSKIIKRDGLILT